MITGQEQYLTPYYTGLQQVTQEMQDLRSQPLASSQQQQLDALEVLIKSKLDQLNRTINVRRSQGLKTAASTAEMDYGNKIMADIRNLIVEMQTQENGLTNQRLTTTIASAHRSALTSLLSISLRFYCSSLGLLVCSP